MSNNPYFHSFTPGVLNDAWPYLFLAAAAVMFVVGLFRYKPGRRVPRMRYTDPAPGLLVITMTTVITVVACLESFSGITQLIANLFAMNFEYASFGAIVVVAVLALVVLVLLVFAYVAGERTSFNHVEKAIRNRATDVLIAKWCEEKAEREADEN